jgi:hypothetical protein
MLKSSKKALDKRKDERKDFPEFFKKHTEIIKDKKACCRECGIPLLGDISEVAHVLNKSYFKSVSTNDENVLYLCGYKQNNCHGKFDNSSNDEFKLMKVFSFATEIFNKLITEIKESVNYKHRERYQSPDSPFMDS